MGDAALRFGRYEALFRIASGGMAEVFAARVRGEGGFEKLVAVKRMLPHLAEDPQFVRMFLDEARVAANLSSANVVQTLDIGRTDEGALYIVMELVLGLSLSELLPLAFKRGGHLPIAVCVETLAQAAMGLHDAHEARTAAGELLGLVHRDVSPQNVLIGLDGRVRLTDFGIARVTEARLVHTQHGTVKGKFAYFSPEQSRGAELDRRSDVFALGIVAWEMLSGRRLFVRESPTTTVDAVRSADIPRLELLRPEIPPVLGGVVHRALDRRIDSRWETARVFSEAMRESLGSAGATPGLLAAFVRGLRPDRIVQLEERMREAVASPQLRTLPDIEVELPDTEATVLDAAPPGAIPPPVEPTTVPRADPGRHGTAGGTQWAAPIARTPAGAPSAPSGATAATALTAHAARTRRRVPRPRAIAVGLGAVIALGVVVALVLRDGEDGASANAPAAPVTSQSGAPAEDDGAGERALAGPTETAVLGASSAAHGSTAAPESGSAGAGGAGADGARAEEAAEPTASRADDTAAARAARRRRRSIAAARTATAAAPREQAPEPPAPMAPAMREIRPGQVLGLPEGLE